MAAPALPPPPISRQTYALSDFDTVRLDAPIEVVVTTGKGVSAIGTGDRDTLDTLMLDISSGVLTIRLRQSFTLGGSGGKARAPTRLSLTTSALRRANVLGSGSLTVDRLKGALADASVQGSGTLTVPRIDAERLNIGLLGAGSILLGGVAPDVTASVSGSGRLDTSALDVRRLRIDAEGSADVQAKASEEARASANGSGRILVTGAGQCTVRKAGSASITCGGEVY